MRILHFADLHIGVETYGRPLPERGWSSRMQDFLDAFDHLVDYAIHEGVDAVIFAGDAFKSREPTQTQQREFARRLRRLSEAKIATFLVAGNHDLPNAENRAHALEIYRTLDVPHVYLGDNAWFANHGLVPQVMETRSGPLQVAFLPWPQVSRWLATRPEMAQKPIDQQMNEIEREMTAAIEAQAGHLDPNIPAILSCHVSLADFLVKNNPGSEQWMTVGAAPTLLRSSLSERHFDYIALGHHHNNMSLDGDTPCWYSGSMQRVDFGEEKQEKGFMVLEVDAARPLGQRVGGSGLPHLEKVEARRFVTVQAKPRDPDPTPEVCSAIERACVRDAIVRVEVEMSAEQARTFRVPEARKLLESAHYVAGIKTVLPNDAARGLLPAGAQPDASSPVETMDLYFRLKIQDEKKRERLMQAARELLVEVEGVRG